MASPVDAPSAQPQDPDYDPEEQIGLPQVETERPAPPPFGIAPLASWAQDAAFSAAVSDAKQQAASAPAPVARGAKGAVEEGYVDPTFQVMTKDTRGKAEPNGKVVYISGQPPSGASSSSKVDSWSRIKGMRLPSDDTGTGALIQLRPDHLDDLWLCSAVAMLYAKPELIARLHTAEPSLGVHAVRLYKDGEAKGVAAEWSTTVVDDQIPCHGKKKPIYSTNVDPGAGPLAAVQKALAKMYGCYEHLTGGRVGSALEDLTGGISDKLYLRDELLGADGVPKQPHVSCAAECAGGVNGGMWGRLSETLQAGHLIGAVYKAKYEGVGSGGVGIGDKPALALKEGAANIAKPGTPDKSRPNNEGRKKAVSLVYPLIEMRVVEGRGFVRCMNRWAKVGDNAAPEYKGEWGVGSASWQNEPAIAKALGGRPPRDNSFWMAWEDFLAGFNKVHICYLPHARGGSYLTVEGEWDEQTGGGRLSAAPNAKWRSNPQFRLTVSQKTTVLIAVSQQDSQTDANDASDAYPHAIGFHVIGGPDKGERRTLSYSDGPLRSSRYACSRQVCRVLTLEPSGPDCVYNLMPATWDPNVYMPFTLTLAASAPIKCEPIPTKGDFHVTTALGAWSAGGNTAGGCPNFPATWTNNPQIRLTTQTGGSLGVGVLSITMPDAELKKFQAQHDELEKRNDTESMLSIGLLVMPIADAETHKAPGGKPALNKRLTSKALGGTMAIDKEQIIASSAFVHGAEEQATVQLDLPPGPGSYLLVPCTFYPGQECNFTLTLYHTDPEMKLIPLKGARLPPPVGGTKGESKGGGKMAPPTSKHDVGQVRAQVKAEASAKEGGAALAAAGKDADGDDGKLGYAQRMEIEEAQKLMKWPENVPLFTVEGAPLSENVKKEKNDKVAKALAYCAQHGGKFEDSGPGGFPARPGRAPTVDAQGSAHAQPEVYRNGKRTGTMPEIVDWCRPEEFAPDMPVMFHNDYSVQGIIQGSGFDNRWFVSALNIVSGNRGQLDRVFFGELSREWIDKGFFVCKFYQDDPVSDDDWAVVLVDDRIPCTRDADGRPFPIFCRNPDPNVYWAMIIEKAYAKLCGSYEAMQGGTVTQGLEDFTGGIGYKFDLAKNPWKYWIPMRPNQKPPSEEEKAAWTADQDGLPDDSKLWFELLEKMMTEHVVGCTVNTKGAERPQTTKKGILLNRAYAVVTAGDFEDNRLMKLRLPLNEDGTATEWTGRWSDNSATWNNRLRQMLAYSSDESDGTFWIEYKDLVKHFNKVYMCRMLDDLWTRVAVKSRWMDETAGGCTNFISWRNNNQWILHITRPKTRFVIKLSQPDARKSSGNGRHYSNAIGFYILKGNAPNEHKDQYRRKLICKDGDEEDGGDFVFCKDPRFSKQVIAEYTFEEASTTPYILMPFIFEPGREQLFKFTLLSDDRDDDGEPDFYFQEVKKEQDWKHIAIKDAFHLGGKGNALAKKYNAHWQKFQPTAGGPLEVPTWTQNCQFQLTIHAPTRVFLFLEARNVKTDMRDVEGLQTEPDYPTMGFHVCRGAGNHVLLGTEWPSLKPTNMKPEVLHTAPAKFGDGVYLELGYLQPMDEKYVVIPFLSEPNQEYEYCLTLYTDLECDFEKIDPTKVAKCDCVQCKNRKSYERVVKRLTQLEKKYKKLMAKETELRNSGKFGTPRPPPAPQQGAHAGSACQACAPPSRPTQPAVADPTPAGYSMYIGDQQPAAAAATPADPVDRMFQAADVDGDGYVSMEDMEQFRRYYQMVDSDADGNISAAELKRATQALQEQGERQTAEFEYAQQHFQRELHTGQEEIRVLMEAVRQAEEAQRAAREAKPSARGRRR